MAFTGNFMCTSFKKELLEAVHDFRNSGGDDFKLALYDNSASFTAASGYQSSFLFSSRDSIGQSGAEHFSQCLHFFLRSIIPPNFAQVEPV